MQYIRVRWLHDLPTEPVLIVSELDADLWEVRKVEVFVDGRRDWATREIEHWGTTLGLVPTPSLSEIAADPQFVPEEITAAEFEGEWSKR